MASRGFVEVTIREKAPLGLSDIHRLLERTHRCRLACKAVEKKANTFLIMVDHSGG